MKPSSACVGMLRQTSASLARLGARSPGEIAIGVDTDTVEVPGAPCERSQLGLAFPCSPVARHGHPNGV